MSLNELAERCEAAKGSSRHLDTQIFILLEPNAQHITGHKPGRFPQEVIYGPRSSFWEWATDETKEPPQFASIPLYTASLDAAMTLVPEGCDWLLNARYNFAQVWEAKETGRDGNWECKHAATPALALCAAALRAREHMANNVEPFCPTADK